MSRKNKLIMLILTTLITAVTLTAMPATAQQITKVAISPQIAPVKAVGEEFTITVTVDDITYPASFGNFWGYQFLLTYNTTVLTALSFRNRANETYSQFNTPAPSEINDNPIWNETTTDDWVARTGSEPDYGNQTGYVAVAYNCPLGDKTGMTATEVKPLTDVTFEVDGLGTTKLDLIDTKVIMGTTKGHSIRLTAGNLAMSDGFFSNTEEIKIHDVAVTNVVLSATTAKAGDVISINVTIANQGNFDESPVTVTVKYNDTKVSFKAIGTPKTATLTPDASTSLTFSWNTANVPDAKYTIRAEATITQDDDNADNIKDSDIITMSSGGGGLSPTVMYIIGGVIALIVVGVIVYALRRRAK